MSDATEAATPEVAAMAEPEDGADEEVVIHQLVSMAQQPPQQPLQQQPQQLQQPLPPQQDQLQEQPLPPQQDQPQEQPLPPQQDQPQEQPTPQHSPQKSPRHPSTAARTPHDGEKVTAVGQHARDGDKLDLKGSVYVGTIDVCELARDQSQTKKLAEDKKGILTLANGSVYEGCFMRGLRHGHGKWVDANGEVYEGAWRDDKAFGHGKLTLPDGCICEGLWANGDMNGKGTKWEADGSKYVGEFYEDKRHGYGEFFNAAGILIRAGEWRKGEAYDPPAKPPPKKRNFKFVDRVRRRACKRAMPPLEPPLVTRLLHTVRASCRCRSMWPTPASVTCSTR